MILTSGSRARFRRAPAFAALVLVPFAPAAFAAHFQCSLEQATNQNSFGVAVGFPSISGDGQRIAYQSVGNQTGENADGNVEIFFYDRATNTQTQITHTTGSQADDRPRPTIDASGTRVAFTSNQDLTGQNADHGWEIFVYDTTAHTLTQATTTPNLGGMENPAISRNGSRVVFNSGINLVGENPDGNGEIYRVTIGGGIDQLTHATSGFASFLPSPNNDGTKVAFHSSTNVTGGAADDSFDIYMFNRGTVVPVTNASGDGGQDIVNASIDGTGSRVVFESRLNLTGANADGSPEVYLWDDGTITQISDGAVNEFNNQASISTNGKYVTWIRNFQVVLYEIATGTISPVTPPDEGSVQLVRPVIDGDGTHVAFVSRTNYANDNPEGNDEIFLATCGPITCDGKNATIVGTDDPDTIDGTGGADVIKGLAGKDIIDGKGGNDTICGDSGNDRLTGGPGNDVVIGGTGNDRLNGNDGTDSLDGGAGSDVCNGGAGTDTAKGCEEKTAIP